MLSIAKLRVGQEAYQLSGVAQSLDDYYTGAGEAHGQWVGGSAARLDLTGEVNPDDLRAVLAGLRPGTGGLTPNGDTPRSHPRRVPGFDLTFKAPKSASVLYAVSDDPRVQGAVIDAGEAAMRATVGWLERQAIQVQRGSHNQSYLERLTPEERALAGPRREGTAGVVAASFRHRTSRASDPLLHWHVLVANLVEGTDGKWSAFAHPELYRHARAAGEVFQAAFRAELTESLGVEWRPGRTVPEIAGIPQALLDTFSKRSTEIEAWLEATGTPNTPQGRQAAVLATRRNKPEVEQERFDTAWKLEADAAGWGPAHADGLIAAAADRSPVDFEGAWRLETDTIDEHGAVDRYERTVDPEEWIADLLRRDLTNDRSTFSRPDLTQAVAARQGAGADIATIERIVARVIASPQTIPVDTKGPEQWTSRELLDTEARFIATLHGSPATPATPDAISQAVATRPTLGDDQQAAIQSLTKSSAPVSVLIGPAGTGKTYTIDAIRDAFERSGIRVIGAAPSARAALELEAAAGIRATTLHRLLDTWDRGYDAPRSDSLLVIDEAGMTDIRTLSSVVTRQTTAGGRVLLAGDHHQLPEIGAGGGFAHAAQHAHTIAELTVNRRQQHSWEHTALTELRHGNVAIAVGQYLDHDRVTVAADPNDLIHRTVEHWTTARAEGLNPIMLAGTNELVDRLNAAAIDYLLAAGQLADTEGVQYGTASFRPGERVLTRRNSTEHTPDGGVLDVANGQAGTIISAADRTLTIAFDHGSVARLDDTYLRRGGHVTHGYALTTHRAQGGTWDLAIAAGADSLYREAAYVQLSRGTHANRLVITAPEAVQLLRETSTDTERHDHGVDPEEGETAEVDQHLTRRLIRSHAKRLAHTLDPNISVVDQLVRTVPFEELRHHLLREVNAERLTTDDRGHTRDDLIERRDRLEHVARHIAVGARVSPADRNNVGTVSQLDDTTGTAMIEFISQDGHHTSRAFSWDELRLIDEPRAQLDLSPEAQTQLDSALDQIDTQIAAWGDTLARHGGSGNAREYSAALHRRIDQAASDLQAHQPEWIHLMLGSRPDDVGGAHTWDDTLRAVAQWRLTSNTPPETAGLGPEPLDPTNATQWRALQQSVAETRVWLTTTDRTLPEMPHRRTLDELLMRSEELDMLLATAPADCRHIIDELRGGQLTFEDTVELLDAAMAQQDARRTWIIEHWPHIVEYQEIDRALLLGDHDSPTVAHVEPGREVESIGPDLDF